MPKAIVAYNNFAKGKVDHDLMARFDLPIYNTSADVMRNFFTNFKGNAIYRTGLEDMIGEFEDCAIQEFLFRNDQNYIMVFYNLKVKFLTYASDGTFGWVQNGGSDLEVTTPYSLAESKELQFDQNGDVVSVTHQDYPPKDLTRVAADNFTLADHSFTGTNPFTAPNYPKSSQFRKGRLYYSGTPDEPTTVWGSEQGDFTNFVVPATATDISPLKFTIADITQPIDWLFSGENSLILGCAEGIVAVNGGSVGAGIKADTIEAQLTPTEGSNDQIPITKDGFVFYQGSNSRNFYYFSYDLLTESFKSEDANFLSYDITKNDLYKIRHKKDRDDLMYSIRLDGKWVTLNFKEKEKIAGWHLHDTQGLVKDVVVISDNDGNPQTFMLVDRGGSFFIEKLADHVEFSERSSFYSWDENNESKEVAKTRDDDAYNRKVAEELRQCVYLDNALKINNLQEGNTITYTATPNGTAFSSAFSVSSFGSGVSGGTIVDTDGVFVSGDVGKHIVYQTATGYESGRFEITGYTDANTVEVDVLQTPTADTYDNWYLSFSSVSGLDQYNGQEVGVVTDGGFLSLFTISGGELSFDQEVTSLVIGYTYRGEIKSFGLGFQAKAENTQVTMKNITQTGIRCVSTAGIRFGSTPYDLEPLQKLSQNDLNYLPPIPIDGTGFIDYIDDNQEDKYFYIVQDEPLPAIIAGVFLNANYTVRQ